MTTYDPNMSSCSDPEMTAVNNQKLGLGSIVSAMSDPRFYGFQSGVVEVRETHCSYVFLVDRYAYKIKKPVVFNFLNYGTLSRRKLMCEKEVLLNRRLAPTIYLGVCSVVSGEKGLRLGGPEERRAVESVVKMRRVDEERTLAGLLATGKIERSQIAAIASRIARFHAGASHIDLPDGGAGSTMRTAHETFTDLLRLVDPALRNQIEVAASFTKGFLKRYERLLAERNQDGLIRDVHGDLRAEHVVINGQLEVIDCIEFDHQLRQIDVGADLSFLVMDLQRLGRSDLSEYLVKCYLKAGGNPGPAPLVAFYAAQRAWIRAKIALIRAQSKQGLSSDKTWNEEAYGLLKLARSLSWKARTPLLVVVCGPAATGKTTLAEEISTISSFPIIGSDRVRKELAGLKPTDRGSETLYAEKINLQTYREVGRLTAKTLEKEGAAIVDATFRRRSDRSEFWQRLNSFEGQVVVVECKASLPITLQRVQQRELCKESISDATAKVALRQRWEFEPLDELSTEQHIQVHTDLSIDESLESLEARIDKKLALQSA